MRFWPSIALLALLGACQSHHIVHETDTDLVQLQKRVHDAKLVSINIMDRNGLSETISQKDRLKNYEYVNFLTSQPYQKVLRVFAKDKAGSSFSVITSYYPSGQIKQYLEAVNGRAHGRYLEWHENGQKKVQATVLGGGADLDEKSKVGWTFDEKSFCWDEEGHCIAHIPYERGTLSGVSRYFHKNGKVSEEIPYAKGVIEGEYVAYDEVGTAVEKTLYVNGLKEGASTGYWSAESLSWNEVWREDLLQEASYFDQVGELICQVQNGRGKRCIFGDAGPTEIQEFVDGKPEGEVLIFDDNSVIVKRLHVKDGEKHGEEIVYWPNHPDIPKLSIHWQGGQIHGAVKSWYEDGTPESSREMSHNSKQGHLTAWYKDGKLMLIEEYEKDRLQRGDYLKRGESSPISQVIDGKGVATFYEPDGTFRARINYQEGKPAIEELLGER